MKEIDQIVPVNESHRKRLERLKSNLGQVQSRFEEEMRINRVEMEIAQQSVQNTRELTELRMALGSEIRDSLLDSHIKQTSLILRIAHKPLQSP